MHLNQLDNAHIFVAFIKQIQMKVHLKHWLYLSRTNFETIPTFDCISVAFIRADYGKGLKCSI